MTLAYSDVRQRFATDDDSDFIQRHNDVGFWVPSDLQSKPVALRRALLVGSCLSEAWAGHLSDRGVKLDYVLTNNIAKLADPPQPFEEYDFQIVQIPLRTIMHENTYLHRNFKDPQSYEELFNFCSHHLRLYLNCALEWNDRHGLTTFLTNFLLPQQNPMGRLLPRNDLRNMVYFIDRLNDVIYEEIAKRKGVYLLDIDQISASIGRRYVQDDAFEPISHGSLLQDGGSDLDQNRIQPRGEISEHYAGILEGRRTFYDTAWAEAVAMHTTIRQTGMVKLVIVDLDDTLWRGVVAEDTGEMDAATLIEGWPVGMMEALCFLKRRGVMLAIVSKNDEARILDLFDKIVGGRLRLQDFVSCKINWNTKAENIAEIMRETSQTPHSVVFVDDSPVERAQILVAFPDIRVMGSHPYFFKRTLLWSPETQVASVSDESARRTEMVQANIEREQVRNELSKEEFLTQLQLRMTFITIESGDHRSFPRCFELLNKTNQFNTTGRRWSPQEMSAFLNGGGTLYTFALRDKYSDYGLVGVALVNGSNIDQFVMSCRVLGLGADVGFLSLIAQQGARSADFSDTPLNGVCRDVYERAGFHRDDSGKWLLDAPQAFPRHIAVEDVA